MGDGIFLKIQSHKILALSRATDWTTARNELALVDIKKADEAETCLCGHHPIIGICSVHNRVTGHQTDVGNAGGVDVSPEEACGTVHSLLKRHPMSEQPGDVSIADGLYFFYEDGELRGHGSEGRIVRVGNHPRSDGTLVRRLWQHYRGGKNGSVFFCHAELGMTETVDEVCVSQGGREREHVSADILPAGRDAAFQCANGEPVALIPNSE